MNVSTAMKRRICSILMPVLAVALLAGIPLTPMGTADARVGARMGAFTLPAIPGGPTRGRMNLGDKLGEDVVVLLFWATWCIPCRQELPVYQELYERYRDQGLTVVAISMDDSSSLPQAAGWARRMNLTFPVLSDLDTSVTNRINPRRTAPFSIWVNHEGRITREHEGFNQGERDEIQAGIAELIRARNAE